MKKVGKVQIKKAIKELGFDIENFQIHKNEIETARTDDFELGNEEVRKVVYHLADQGATYHGFKAGYGAWIFRFEARSYTSELVSMNMD
jgi:hypothetical protein